MSDKEGFFTREEQDEILNSIPKDPQYNGEVVKKENTGLLGFFKTKKVEENEVEEKEDRTDDKKEGEKNEEEKNEEKNESTGFLTTLLGTGEVDCDKLLKNMNECVSEKDGTTMCRKQIDEWEKLCKNEDKDENKDE
jgi:predicted RNA-binding protein Jag